MKESHNAGITQQMMNVTPAMAKAWLATSRGNRNIRKSHVDALAYAMATDWDPTLPGSVVMFDEAGSLKDAHHRCHAVVRYGRPVPMMVWHNVPDDVLRRVDVCRISRTLADQARMLHGVADARKVVALAHGLVAIETPLDWNKRGLVDAEVQAILKLEGHGISKFLPLLKKRHLRGSRTVAALIWANAVWPEATSRFAGMLSSMEGTSPAAGATLRFLENLARASNTRGSGHEQQGQAMGVLRGLWAELNSEPLKLIRTTGSDDRERRDRQADRGGCYCRSPGRWVAKVRGCDGRGCFEEDVMQPDQEVLDRLRTLADELSGPHPVLTLVEALDEVERAAHEWRIKAMNRALPSVPTVDAREHCYGCHALGRPCKTHECAMCSGRGTRASDEPVDGMSVTLCEGCHGTGVR